MPKLVLVLWLLVRARGLDLVDLVEPPASKAQSRGGLVSRSDTQGAPWPAEEERETLC